MLRRIWILNLLFCLACSSQSTPLTVTADKIIVSKSARQLQLLKGSKILKTYRIALGGDPVGHKQKEGDNRTPEGVYLITQHNPRSQFYKSLRISYPNEKDRQNASKLGVSPGGDIMIHGLGKNFGLLGKLHLLKDWTLGCIAVTNEEIDEIFELVPDGAVIEIQA